MQKTSIQKLIASVAAFLLLYAILFTSLQIVMNDQSWYAEKYAEYGTAAEIGIPNDDIVSAIMQLVKYMEGDVSSIQLTVSEYGQTVEMYNQREIDHMVDVQVLYQTFRTVRNVSLVIALILFAIAIKTTPKTKKISTLSMGVFFGMLAFASIIAAVGAWVVIDFESFWLNFHYLLFTNDLWLLDYNTDRMIRICPAELFSDIIIRFGTLFSAAFLTLGLIAAALKINITYIIRKKQ